MTTDNTVPAVIANESLPVATAGTRTANIMALMQQGIERGMTPEALGQLANLYERFAAKDAEAQFLEAKRAFQSECPVIGKNRNVDVKTKEGKQGAKYRFADLEKIVHTIRPLLDKHGFSYDFAQAYEGNIVTVTCFLRHKAGHVEATKFSGPWETSASMSAIQKSASATTFCQRYALRMALGLPVGEDDDAPPDRHENPDARPDAPEVKPRGQRRDDNEPPIVNHSKAVNAIKREWVAVYGEEYANDKAAMAKGFVAWCLKTFDDEWNPSDIGDWTLEKVDACELSLGMRGGE